MDRPDQDFLTPEDFAYRTRAAVGNGLHQKAFRMESGAIMRAFGIGHIALDETVTVQDLPAPGTSIHRQASLSDLGGKGANQAIVLGRARIGLPPLRRHRR
jgi:hypothetical protein